MIIVPIIVLAVLLGLIPATIASRKGHSFFEWWVFGASLWIFALPLSIRLSDRRPRCPHCRELVQVGATICPHCRSALEPAELLGEPARARPFSHIKPL